MDDYLMELFRVELLSLWGSALDPKRRAEITEARRPVRERFGVTGDSLLKSRAVRNGLEHFDERMVEWYEREGATHFVSRQVGPMGTSLLDITENLKQVAVVIENVPNALLEGVVPLTPFLNSEAQF